MEVFMSISIDDFYKCPFTLARLNNCGYLSSHLNPFAEWMVKQLFSEVRLRFHISNVAHFSYSLKEEKPDINDLNTHIKTFLKQHIKTCKCKGWKQPRNPKYISYSLNRFKEYLTDCHKFDFKLENLVFSKIHNKYLCWLSDSRYLESNSVNLRSAYLRQFLKWYEENSSHKELKKLKSFEVETFFIHATSQAGTAYKRSMQATLRSFFDFCYEHGYTLQNLRFSLPVIKTYRLSKLPKQINENEASYFLENINKSTKCGKRAYVIILLLNTYGIRGCQIRRLEFKDIEWRKEEINFPPAKNGKKCSFPLTTEIGNALLDYLQNVRYKSQRHQEVFLTLRPPYIPLTSKTLAALIKYEMLKVGVKSPSNGAHCFRHSFVSRMLNQGEPIKHIADLIGHKHIQTTFIYTKIDFKSLDEVALELPEVKNENY